MINYLCLGDFVSCLAALLPVPHGDDVVWPVVDGKQQSAAVGFAERQTTDGNGKVVHSDYGLRVEGHRVPDAHVGSRVAALVPGALAAGHKEFVRVDRYAVRRQRVYFN